MCFSLLFWFSFRLLVFHHWHCPIRWSAEKNVWATSGWWTWCSGERNVFLSSVSTEDPWSYFYRMSVRSSPRTLVVSFLLTSHSPVSTSNSRHWTKRFFLQGPLLASSPRHWIRLLSCNRENQLNSDSPWSLRKPRHRWKFIYFTFLL